MRGDKLALVEAGSRIKGFQSDLSEGAGAKIDALAVPEGKRIFQFAGHTRKMQSTLGQALNFAAETLNRYQAIDDQGRSYDTCGYYALVKIDGKEYVEFFFTPDPGEVGYNGELGLDQPTRRALRDQEDAIFGLYFVVPPGTCIKKVVNQNGQGNDFSQPICVGK